MFNRLFFKKPIPANGASVKAEQELTLLRSVSEGVYAVRR
jgi:hypothetical protein